MAMAVTELWTGSVISRGGSLLYIFIAVNASLPWVTTNKLLNEELDAVLRGQTILDLLTVQQDKLSVKNIMLNPIPDLLGY